MGRRGVAVVALLAVLVLPGCAEERLKDAEALRAIMRRTERDARAFVYREQAGANEYVVKGVVNDDFRYKATLSLDGTALYDEVVDDDAVAARALQPRGLDLLARPPSQLAANPGLAEAAQPEGGPPIRGVLESGRWVLDQVGAPSLLPSASEKHLLGDDPIFDALTVFRYIDQAMGEAFRVRRFDPDASDYKPKEDPFPKPDKGGPVTRYDIERPRVPRPQDAAGRTANQIVPAARHFRKMVVYVRDGRVIQVLEEMDVLSRLKDLQSSYNIDIPAALPDEEKVAVVIDAINAVRRSQGDDPIRVRSMSLEFVRAPSTSVDLPTDTVAGSLLLLKNRGRVPVRGPGTPTAAATPPPAAPAPAGG